MDNGVFISLPEISNFDPRTIFSRFPDKVKEINMKHFNVSKTLYPFDTIYQAKIRNIRSPHDNSSYSDSTAHVLPTDETATVLDQLTEF